MLIIYDNLTENATKVASSTNALFPLANLDRLASTDEWRSTAAPANIVYSLATAKKANAVSVVGNNYLRALTASKITLQGNASDSWASPSFELELTLSTAEGFAYATFPEQNFQYWRLVFEGAGYVAASSVFLGESFSLVTNDFDIGLTFTEADLTEVSFSTTGRRFIDSQNVRVKTIDATISTMNKTETEAWRGFVQTVGKRKPFFLMVDPNALILTNEGITAGMFMINEVSPLTQQALGLWETNFSATEVI
jgi:hypothetical protein